MKKIILSILISLISTNVFAVSPFFVEKIEVFNDNAILISKVGGFAGVVGACSTSTIIVIRDATLTPQALSILLTAKQAGKQVAIRTTGCNTTNTTYLNGTAVSFN